jgi:hypothetical protein
MLSSAKFFEGFDKAGFLKPASWTPSGGGGPYTPRVRYRAPATTLLSDGLRTVDHEIQYVTEQLPGLAEGEQITVDGVLYRVRMRPEALLDGTVSRAELARVIA